MISRLAQAVPGGRRVCPANLHITLVFLGATTAERLACYEAALEDLAVPMLSLTLDRFGYWPRSRILWLGTNQTPDMLMTLLDDLKRRLKACGFTPEQRSFHAHITLARKFPDVVSLPRVKEPLNWQVNCVTFMESINQDKGVHYQVLQRWPKDSLNN
jgi:2'-5' RNA ligase